MVDSIRFSHGLEYLLKASSKVIVEKCINLIFISRNEITNGIKVCTDKLQELLEINENEAKELYDSISECISTTLYYSSAPLESLAELLEEKASGVNNKLKQLIGQTIKSHLSIYRESISLARVSYPELQSVDWNVNILKSTNEINSLSIPIISLQLKVKDPATNTSTIPNDRIVNVSITKETLVTMLEGLGKIRDQLSSMS